jgi:hypothetical protein
VPRIPSPNARVIAPDDAVANFAISISIFRRKNDHGVGPGAIPAHPCSVMARRPTTFAADGSRKRFVFVSVHGAPCTIGDLQRQLHDLSIRAYELPMFQ